MKRVILIFAGLLSLVGFNGCGAAAEKTYLADLRTHRRTMDIDRLVLAVKCGEFVTIWSDAVDRKIDVSETVASGIQERAKSADWQEYKTMWSGHEAKMLKLSNPPQRFSSIHEKLVRQHGILTQLVKLAESPSGSLVSYSSEVQRLKSEYDQLKAELDVSVPLDA